MPYGFNSDKSKYTLPDALTEEHAQLLADMDTSKDILAKVDRKLYLARHDAASIAASNIRSIYLGNVTGKTAIDLTYNGSIYPANAIYNFQVSIGSVGGVAYNATIAGRSLYDIGVANNKTVLTNTWNSDSNGYFSLNLTRTSSGFNAALNAVYDETTDVTSTSGLWVYAIMLPVDEDVPSYMWSGGYLASRLSALRALDAQVEAHGGASFAFVTDTHVDNANNSPELLRKVIEGTDTDTLIHGGDFIDQPRHAGEAIGGLTGNLNRYRYIAYNTYAVVGNHDYGNNGGHVGSEISSNVLLPAFTGQLDRSVSTNGNLYYYADNTEQKIRYYILESHSGSIDSTQLSWFKNSVNALSSDWTIVVAVHMAINNSGRGDRTNITLFDSGTQIANVLDNAKAHVACVVCGHMHIDISMQRTKYAIVATTCDACGRDDNRSYLYSDDVRTRGTRAEQAIDVVHIDKTEKKVYFTRIGGGQKDITSTTDFTVNDRVFTYK